MTTIPHYIFLYGLTGVGKSYCGKALAQALGAYFYDLDEDITDAMRVAIAEGRPFTDQLRDEFFEVVCKRISDLKASHPRCIFAQGAYRQRHRDRVHREHPDVVFVMVDAPYELIRQRVQRRSGAVSNDYAATLKKSFEEPPSDGLVLVNDNCSSSELLQRFHKLFGR